MDDIEAKIRDKKARIAVIGLGYVGLPVAVEFAKKGFTVYGFDLDREKIARLKKGSSYIKDVSSSEIREFVRAGHFVPSFDPAVIRRSHAVILCVPTPLNKLKEPDISFVLEAIDTVKSKFVKGQLIILESTTYPGTTEEMILPRLSQGGCKVGRDFYLAFSPERIDPGNPNFPFPRIPKVVGGVTSRCSRLAELLYGHVVAKVVPVSSPRVAEFTKLLENTFRIVNIGLINELATVSQKMGVNIWEAIEAAKTKPFGYMPFFPGPGIGGHCIGIDPLYLSWKAKLAGSEIRFVELASRTNAAMPGYVVQRSVYALNVLEKSVKDSNILILGAAYKKDIDDIRESPALEIIKELGELGAKISYHDPFVKALRWESAVLRSSPLTDTFIKKQDLVILVTDHSGVDYEKVVRLAPLVIDTRNALKNIRGRRDRIVLL